MLKTEIQTEDGRCPSYVFRPGGAGPWPAVLFFMDGVGIRPSMFEMGRRLATHGYFVLLPDLFYRSGPYEPMDPRTLFTDPEKRKVLTEKFFALATAPKIIVAAASYHGGRLATDAPESPHLLAPRMKARVYVAGAIEDASFPDEMKARLEDALTKAGVDHVVETYPAKHGWVPSDMPVHDPACAERHWKTLVALLDAKLKG
jgi:carboxymethylenebutenolidase